MAVHQLTGEQSPLWRPDHRRHLALRVPKPHPRRSDRIADIESSRCRPRGHCGKMIGRAGPNRTEAGEVVQDHSPGLFYLTGNGLPAAS
ncbi:hypothetical protein DMH04_10980 [Kibdelosporangium aridum]|uniref:Uncharacterized protein n=1 Tax=Kibdelosporangium aridum TaxID=2030 RepID=A0A428ZHT0_KIBAR|nr:hypothetical protein DMH04_10980 [Kibdelosporangium aridum]